MGRNAYINFYMWYYNEHRGQAPVTTIAKRAGMTWRKMTPQEKGRFMDRNYYPKGNMPMYITKSKFQKVNVNKAPHKSIRKSKRSPQHGKHSSQRNVREKQKTMTKAKLKEEENEALQKGERSSKDDGGQKQEAVKEEEENETESEETLARRKSIQRWMDENHYT